MNCSFSRADVKELVREAMSMLASEALSPCNNHRMHYVVAYHGQTATVASTTCKSTCFSSR